MPDAEPQVKPRRRRWVSLQDRLLLTVAALVTAAVLVASATSMQTALVVVSGVIEDPERAAAVRAEVADVMRGVAGVALATLALLLPMVYLSIARAFAPLRRLANAADSVAEGRFATVDIAGAGDTVGRLADSFNRMVERVAEQTRLAAAANAGLVEANRTLERKVADRTAAIEAATARLSSEIAEKEDFLRAVSHDLNAPLRNIDGMVSMIARKHGESLPDDVLRKLDRVRHNVRVETDLIGEVLELSRIKTRRGDLEVVNLQELVWDIRGVFDNDLRENEIDLVVESQLPRLRAEKARVRQVFQNLIDNAIKYMGDGPVRRIAVGSRVGPDEVTFWVRDTGIGIKPDDAEKVFYVFRRGENHAGVEGKGVGLASVKSIVETYQGTITCAPNDEGGTTFTFSVNGRYLADDRRVVLRQGDQERRAA